MKFFFSNRSIAFRLIVAVLAVEALSSLLVVFLSFGYERNAHFRAFSVMLDGRANALLGAVQDAEDPQDNLILNQADLDLPREHVWEVFDQNGRLLGRSTNWQGIAGFPTARWRHGYLDLDLNHQHYAVMHLHGFRTVDPETGGGGKVRQVDIYYGAPVDPIWRQIRGAVAFYAAGSLILLLITGPLIAWLLHRGLFPLRQLAALASNVSANSWQFTPPASARNTTELAPLTQAIESVLERLERAFKQQRVFVSDAAHELKTAVAVIKSTLQVLDLRSRTASEYRAGLERCLADCERLEELVAKMLTLARVEGGENSAVQAAVCDLVASLNEAAGKLAPVALARNLQITVRVPDAGNVLVPLFADDSSILISNLLLNALQHSHAGSQIEVQITSEGTMAQLLVYDHGEGIDPAVLPHVFDRFYRGDPSRARSTGGVGLGLAICKAIVDRASGSIVIESNPSHGTTVNVSLPLFTETLRNDSPPSA
jgi:signal transduction histidine kinase